MSPRYIFGERYIFFMEEYDLLEAQDLRQWYLESRIRVEKLVTILENSLLDQKLD